MKYIRHLVRIGNWEVGHERPESDDVAGLLVKERKAEFIDRLGPPKDKVLKTFSQVVEDAANVEADAPKATAVKRK